MLGNLVPEIQYARGNTVVPAKAVTYKKLPDGTPIETVKPNTLKFEKELREDLKKELADVPEFPTDKEVLVSIFYGVHSKTDYSRHDLDNRSKTILDALKDVVYIDDSQVSILCASKEFLERSQESSILILIKVIDEALKQKLLKEVNGVS